MKKFLKKKSNFTYKCTPSHICVGGYPILHLGRGVPYIRGRTWPVYYLRKKALVAQSGYQTTNPGSPGHISGSQRNLFKNFSWQCVFKMDKICGSQAGLLTSEIR